MKYVSHLLFDFTEKEPNFDYIEGSFPGQHKPTTTSVGSGFGDGSDIFHQSFGGYLNPFAPFGPAVSGFNFADAFGSYKPWYKG